MDNAGKSFVGSQRTSTVDELVATYASRGARQNRQRLVRRVSIASGLAIAIAGGVIVGMSDLHLAAVFPGNDAKTAAKDVADANELAAEKAQFAERMAELEQQLASVKSQKQELEEQRARFVEQSEALARMLSDISSQQASLESRQHLGSQLNQEISAIAAQRKALEQRWSQFEAQGELLAMEIVAVNAQRKELESQRQKIDRQQKELAELLERADGLYRESASSQEDESSPDASTTAVDENSVAYAEDSLLVGNDELNEMRGGFKTGEGFDVSFGFVQTGSLNGVEQFSNKFTIDSMASGSDSIDLSGMNPVLLQNGTGNLVSSGALDALSNSFGSVIQNTLDDQIISTTTVIDIDLHNVRDAIQGIYGEQALTDSLSAY